MDEPVNRSSEVPRTMNPAPLTSPEERGFIATKADRQAFFTHVMYNDEVPWRERIRSAELLGKSEGDFVERVDLDARVGGVMFGVVMDPEERAKLLNAFAPSLCLGSAKDDLDEDEE